MSNSLGKQFVVTIFGESHGKCIGAVIDGCPAGLHLSEDTINRELEKRIPKDPEIISARVEEDKAEIISGVFNGRTTGAPIAILIPNKDVDSSPYELIRNKPRPGHADYPAFIKYGGFNDYRGGGIFSGRITAAFVAAGAVAKKLLKIKDIEVLAYAKEIGGVRVNGIVPRELLGEETYMSPVRCPIREVADRMRDVIIEAKNKGDSVGGVVECVAYNLPVGVGEPIFDSLDAELAKALFSIPAVKGVEFGEGFAAARLKGSQNNDEYTVENGKITTATNRAGGVLGGMSSGQPLVLRVAFKPPASIKKKQKTVDMKTMKNVEITVPGRHDPCVVPKAVPVVEAVVAIVLVDHLLRGQFIPRVLQ